jgi:hypothetical protein
MLVGTLVSALGPCLNQNYKYRYGKIIGNPDEKKQTNLPIDI